MTCEDGSRVPWRTEVALDAEIAAGAIAERFPALAPLPVTRLAEGYDNVAFDVGGAWVFRFPKRAEVVPGLRVEWRFLPELAPELPLPISAALLVAEGAAAFALPFGGYPRIPGVLMTERTAESADLAAIGRSMGALLTSLHAFPTDRARRAGVAGPEDSAARIAWVRNLGRDCLRLTRATLGEPLARRFEQFLADDARVPLPYAGAPRVIHNDLGADHVLVREDASEVTGVIDWTDARIGDPSGDFVGLWTWGGDHLLESTLASYGGPLPADLPARVRWAALHVALDDLRYHVAYGNDSGVARALEVIERAV